MDESTLLKVEDALLHLSSDFEDEIASLRAAGAEKFDAVQLRYLEVLAKRALSHQGNVKSVLDAKLTQALTTFKKRFTEAQSNAEQILADSLIRYSHAANDLQQLFTARDFKGLHRFATTLKSNVEKSSSLIALVHKLEEHSPQPAKAHLDTGSRSELKTIRKFRTTWAKLSVDKQVSKALQQAPTNAGPINSHMLVLRSLSMMRDISPDYLNRFMSYVDTLLCLDQPEKEKSDVPKKSQGSKTTRK